VAVQGDLLAPGLGLSEQDMRRLKREVQIIIHSAASIELEADIHKTLRSNYCGTKEVRESL